jgi:hypothetical protein
VAGPASAAGTAAHHCPPNYWTLHQLSVPAALPAATGWKEAEGAATHCPPGAIGSGKLDIEVKIRPSAEKSSHRRLPPQRI